MNKKIILTEEQKRLVQKIMKRESHQARVDEIISKAKAETEENNKR